jgi:transcriptional regulator with XRE-family HTH domain
MLTTIMKTLGLRIKELRQQQSLSLRALGGKLEGVSAAHLSDIERGRRYPSKELLTKIAGTLGTDFGELLQHDTRDSLKDLKQLAELNPAIGMDIQRVIESHKSAHNLAISTSKVQFAGSSLAVSETQAATEMIVRLIASGLVQLYDQFARTGRPPQASYSKKLQRGFDRLVASCLLHGQSPPQSVPDLIKLCEIPFKQWPFPALPEDVHPDDTLLHNHQPSFFCEDFARTDRDIEAAISEERFMQRVFSECAFHPPEIYTSLREMLVLKPVLDEKEFILCYTRPPLILVADLVRDAYEEAPGFLSHKGFFACCPGCYNLLLYSREKGWLCRDESCSFDRVRDNQIARHLPVSGDQVYQLKHALRRYIAAPGRFELKLRDALQSLSLRGKNVSVELYPFVDAYDLRVTFPDQEVWAIDAKDWASPYRLAESITPFRTRPIWDRAFYVFPDRHKRKRLDYLEAFRGRCLYINERVGSLFESDLIAAARRKVRDLV